jgi:hypothetical protein
MRKVFVTLGLAVLFASVLVPAASASHSWGNYHWARTANPFTLSIGDNVSSAWDGYLRTASSDWSADTAGNPLNLTVTVAAGKGKCGSVSGRIEVCSGAYGNNGWLGLAQIWVSSGSHITRGNAKVNDTYYSLPKYNTPAWRASVMCQEIGHTFGLDHQDESGADFHTCMDYADNPDADNMHPNRHDYEQLAVIYSHLDATTTIGASAANAGRSPRLVAVYRQSDSKTSTVVRRYSDGSKRITVKILAR